jgi:hypothetical protein
MTDSVCAPLTALKAKQNEPGARIEARRRDEVSGIRNGWTSTSTRRPMRVKMQVFAYRKLDAAAGKIADALASSRGCRFVADSSVACWLVRGAG